MEKDHKEKVSTTKSVPDDNKSDPEPDLYTAISDESDNEGEFYTGISDGSLSCDELTPDKCVRESQDVLETKKKRDDNTLYTGISDDSFSCDEGEKLISSTEDNVENAEKLQKQSSNEQCKGTEESSNNTCLNEQNLYNKYAKLYQLKKLSISLKRCEESKLASKSCMVIGTDRSIQNSEKTFPESDKCDRSPTHNNSTIVSISASKLVAREDSCALLDQKSDCDLYNIGTKEQPNENERSDCVLAESDNSQNEENFDGSIETEPHSATFKGKGYEITSNKEELTAGVDVLTTTHNSEAVQQHSTTNINENLEKIHDQPAIQGDNDGQADKTETPSNDDQQQKLSTAEAKSIISTKQEARADESKDTHVQLAKETRPDNSRSTLQLVSKMISIFKENNIDITLQMQEVLSKVPAPMRQQYMARFKFSFQSEDDTYVASEEPYAADFHGSDSLLDDQSCTTHNKFNAGSGTSSNVPSKGDNVTDSSARSSMSVQTLLVEMKTVLQNKLLAVYKSGAISGVPTEFVQKLQMAIKARKEFSSSTLTEVHKMSNEMAKTDSVSQNLQGNPERKKEHSSLESSNVQSHEKKHEDNLSKNIDECLPKCDNPQSRERVKTHAPSSDISNAQIGVASRKARASSSDSSNLSWDSLGSLSDLKDYQVKREDSRAARNYRKDQVYASRERNMTKHSKSSPRDTTGDDKGTSQKRTTYSSRYASRMMSSPDRFQSGGVSPAHHQHASTSSRGLSPSHVRQTSQHSIWSQSPPRHNPQQSKRNDRVMQRSHSPRDDNKQPVYKMQSAHKDINKPSSSHQPFAPQRHSGSPTNKYSSIGSIDDASSNMERMKKKDIDEKPNHDEWLKNVEQFLSATKIPAKDTRKGASSQTQLHVESTRKRSRTELADSYAKRSRSDQMSDRTQRDRQNTNTSRHSERHYQRRDRSPLSRRNASPHRGRSDMGLHKDQENVSRSRSRKYSPNRASSYENDHTHRHRSYDRNLSPSRQRDHTHTRRETTPGRRRSTRTELRQEYSNNRLHGNSHKSREMTSSSKRDTSSTNRSDHSRTRQYSPSRSSNHSHTKQVSPLRKRSDNSRSKRSRSPIQQNSTRSKQNLQSHSIKTETYKKEMYSKRLADSPSDEDSSYYSHHRSKSRTSSDRDKKHASHQKPVQSHLNDDKGSQSRETLSKEQSQPTKKHDQRKRQSGTLNAKPGLKKSATDSMATTSGTYMKMGSMSPISISSFSSSLSDSSLSDFINKAPPKRKSQTTKEISLSDFSSDELTERTISPSEHTPGKMTITLKNSSYSAASVLSTRDAVGSHAFDTSLPSSRYPNYDVAKQALPSEATSSLYESVGNSPMQAPTSLLDRLDRALPSKDPPPTVPPLINKKTLLESMDRLLPQKELPIQKEMPQPQIHHPVSSSEQPAVDWRRFEFFAQKPPAIKKPVSILKKTSAYSRPLSPEESLVTSRPTMSAIQRFSSAAPKQTAKVALSRSAKEQSPDYRLDDIPSTSGTAARPPPSRPAIAASTSHLFPSVEQPTSKQKGSDSASRRTSGSSPTSKEGSQDLAALKLQLPSALSNLFRNEDILAVEIGALLRSPEALKNPVIMQVMCDLSDAINGLDEQLSHHVKTMILKEYTVQLLKRFA